MTSFYIGDIVFAKLKGIRHWPATISNITRNGNTTALFHITFFGDNTTATVKESNMAPYQENIHTYGKQLTENFKNKNFNAALREAELAFKALSLNKTNKTLSEPTKQYTGNQLLNDSGEINNVTVMDGNSSASYQPEKTIEDVQNKIKHLQETEELETSLTLAAEAGNALLAENSRLRQDLYDMTLRNSQLQRDNSYEKYLTELQILEDKIEKLEGENEIILNKNMSLTEKLNEVEHQLNKEKEFRNTLMETFEKQDKEQEKSIYASENEIKLLKTEINKLNLQITENKNGEAAQCFKPVTATETQKNPEPSFQNTTITVLQEVAQLKMRQNEMERSVKELQDVLKKQNAQSESSSPLLTTQSTPHLRSLSHLRSNQFNKSVKKARGPLRNHFSVSLQVAKSKASVENAQPTMTTHIKATKKNESNFLNTPKGLIAEKQYICNVSEGSNLKKANLNNTNHSIHFLELRQKKENKQKITYRSRIIINTKLKKLI